MQVARLSGQLTSLGTFMMQALPPKPKTVQPSANGKRARSWLTVAFSLIMIAMTLSFISAFSVGFTIVLGSFVAFISFHYFVWGWWLGKMIQDEDGGDG
jgi:hypothetical protein